MKELFLKLPVDVLVMYALAIQAVLFALLLFFLCLRLRKTNRLLASFQQNWSLAESTHKTFIDEAREKLIKVSSAGTPVPQLASTPRISSLSSEIRAQVLALGKKGFSAAEIAHTCSAPENDISVLLGFARLQK